MTQILASTVAAVALKTVKLDQPFARGDTTIEQVQVRRPSSGELRGLNVSDLAQMNVDATIKLLQRITVPPLSKNELDALVPSDLTQLGMEIQDFLLPKSARGQDFPEA